MVVCFGVRAVGVWMPSPPRDLTSLKAAAYWGLPIGGGGGTENFRTLGMANGVTAPQSTPRAIWRGCSGSTFHLPGRRPKVYDGTTLEPSLTRLLRIWVA